MDKSITHLFYNLANEDVSDIAAGGSEGLSLAPSRARERIAPSGERGRVCPRGKTPSIGSPIPSIGGPIPSAGGFQRAK